MLQQVVCEQEIPTSNTVRPVCGQTVGWPYRRYYIFLVQPYVLDAMPHPVLQSQSLISLILACLLTW